MEPRKADLSSTPFEQHFSHVPNVSFTDYCSLTTRKRVVAPLLLRKLTAKPTILTKPNTPSPTAFFPFSVTSAQLYRNGNKTIKSRIQTEQSRCRHDRCLNPKPAARPKPKEFLEKKWSKWEGLSKRTAFTHVQKSQLRKLKEYRVDRPSSASAFPFENQRINPNRTAKPLHVPLPDNKTRAESLSENYTTLQGWEMEKDEYLRHKQAYP